ncbi:MAG: (4Fe-4S)-binding protein [Cyclobacteriaceae bacterium]
MKKDIKKEYSNGELTIVWQPSKCTHAGVCARTLPKVYAPRAKPWITPENATTGELISQINSCPSGALSFYMNEEKS